jgi:hypothetical protein
MSNATSTMSKQAQNNLDEIEVDAISSSRYFKPRPGTTYVLQVDLDKHQIVPTESEKFKDPQGKPTKRYELVIMHVNNQKEQVWTVSKTVCLQIIGEIRKGSRTLKVTRIGSDKNTIYQIEGVQ